MTRAERFAQQEARAKARLEAQRKQLTQVQAQRRQAEQRARAQRWQSVGRLVDQAGLFALDDITLRAVFLLIGRVALLDEPVPALEALVRSLEHPALASGAGMAQAAPGVAPDGASGV
jgi:hypothetical protein